jgi:hypothetical protein
MPNALKIRLPARENTQRTIPQVHAERRAITRRSDAGKSAVMAKNMGITAKGSTRKKTDVAASRVNSKTCVNIWCMGRLTIQSQIAATASK